MFDLRKMLNTLFGKELTCNSDGEVLNFDMDLFLKSIFGEIKLDDKPNYEIASKRKSISLVNGNGDIKLRVSSYDTKSKMFEVCCVNTLNNYEFVIHILGNNGKIEFDATGSKDFFILKDGMVDYYSEDSINAYSVLGGHGPKNDDCDFDIYSIKPDDSIAVRDIENFEKYVGTFIKKNIFNPNKKANFDLNTLVDDLSNGFFDGESFSLGEFKLSRYFSEMYRKLFLPLADEEPGFKVINSEEADTKILRVKGDAIPNLEFVTISSSRGLINGEKTIDIVATNKESKVYTTLRMVDGQFSFFSKLLSNGSNDEVMDPVMCELIVGDSNGVAYYNNDSVDAYAKLANLAFKMELDDQQSFEDYFVFPDFEASFDSELPIDTQLGEVVRNNFFTKTEKVDNKLVLKRED